jgi:L,D-transpeptidase YcbB
MLRTGVSRSKIIRAASVAALAVAAASPVALTLPTAASAQRLAAPNGDLASFYQARGGQPLWFSPRSGAAARQLAQLLATARADNRNPGRYHAGAVARAIRDAQSGNPEAIRRADVEISQAFVAYVQDLKRDPGVGIIYVDPELRPAPPSPRAILADAAAAPSLSDYITQMQFMNPIYASLRQALASRIYGNARQQRLLVLNLERARALPSGRGRYVIVNPPAARLYMYENGRVVDSMRVVAGRPGQVSETPMMNAFIRYVALNPYWNSPPDITARKLAPKVLTGGRAYLNRQGYEVVDQFGAGAHVLNPMSVDWRGVVAGRVRVNLRQKPGPANSMGRMKFMFPNAQGIWLHDTPEKEKIEDAARLQSNGCVRLEDARRLERWLFNGRAPNPQGARPEQKVNLPQMVPVYITYLTAVPSGTQIVYFDDFYGKDQGQMRSMRMASL